MWRATLAARVGIHRATPLVLGGHDSTLVRALPRQQLRARSSSRAGHQRGGSAYTRAHACRGTHTSTAAARTRAGARESARAGGEPAAEAAAPGESAAFEYATRPVSALYGVKRTRAQRGRDVSVCDAILALEPDETAFLCAGALLNPSRRSRPRAWLSALH